MFSFFSIEKELFNEKFQGKKCVFFFPFKMTLFTTSIKEEQTFF